MPSGQPQELRKDFKILERQRVMALQVASQVHHVLGNLHRAHGRARAALEKMHDVTRTAFRTAEVGASAFGFGMLQGRLPADKQHVMGVDIGLGSAVVLHVLGYAGIGGDYAGHLHAIGDGALASFLTSQGIKMGAQLAKKKFAAATFAEGARLAGDDIEGQSLSDEELSGLAAKR